MLTIRNYSSPDVRSLISPFSIVGNADGDRQEKALTSNLHENFIKVFPLFRLCPKSQGCKMSDITKKEKANSEMIHHKNLQFFIQFVSVFSSCYFEPFSSLHLFTVCNSAKAG